jgi:hypothetical protein
MYNSILGFIGSELLYSKATRTGSNKKHMSYVSYGQKPTAVDSHCLCCLEIELYSAALLTYEKRKQKGTL